MVRIVYSDIKIRYHRRKQKAGNLKASDREFAGRYNHWGPLLQRRGLQNLLRLAQHGQGINGPFKQLGPFFQALRAAAINELHRRFERMLVSMVNGAIASFGGTFEPWRLPQGPDATPPHAPDFDDLFHAARERFSEVIRTYKLPPTTEPIRPFRRISEKRRAKTRFAKYAAKAIAGAIHDEVMRWQLRGRTYGTAGDEKWSRADRWLYDNPPDERCSDEKLLAEIIKATRCDPKSAKAAIM